MFGTEDQHAERNPFSYRRQGFSGTDCIKRPFLGATRALVATIAEIDPFQGATRASVTPIKEID